MRPLGYWWWGENTKTDTAFVVRSCALIVWPEQDGLCLLCRAVRSRAVNSRAVNSRAVRIHSKAVNMVNMTRQQRKKPA